jgi:preprotein translocase subunit YajC
MCKIIETIFAVIISFNKNVIFVFAIVIFLYQIRLGEKKTKKHINKIKEKCSS